PATAAHRTCSPSCFTTESPIEIGQIDRDERVFPADRRSKRGFQLSFGIRRRASLHEPANRQQRPGFAKSRHRRGPVATADGFSSRSTLPSGFAEGPRSHCLEKWTSLWGIVSAEVTSGSRAL